MVLGSVRYCRSNLKLHLGGPGGKGENRTLHMALRITERQRHKIVKMNNVSMYE